MKIGVVLTCSKAFIAASAPKNRQDIQLEVCKENYIETNYKLLQYNAIQQTYTKNTSDNFFNINLTNACQSVFQNCFKVAHIRDRRKST